MFPSTSSRETLRFSGNKIHCSPRDQSLSVKCCMKNLTSFKFEPTTPNMSQHLTTGWPNARNMLHPTMLRYVALKCCDRLARALKLKAKQMRISRKYRKTRGNIVAEILVSVWDFDWLRKRWLVGGANFFIQSQSGVK